MGYRPAAYSLLAIEGKDGRGPRRVVIRPELRLRSRGQASPESQADVPVLTRSWVNQH